jgi:hypothetical protein
MLSSCPLEVGTTAFSGADAMMVEGASRAFSGVRLDTPSRARAERRVQLLSLPCRSALHESEKLRIDHVGVCRTHAVWEALVDLESPLLQQFRGE